MPSHALHAATYEFPSLQMKRYKQGVTNPDKQAQMAERLMALAQRDGKSRLIVKSGQPMASGIKSLTDGRLYAVYDAAARYEDVLADVKDAEGWMA